MNYPSNEPSAYACWYDFSSPFSGSNLIKSSIRKIVIAASVANLRLLTFDIAGSNTPAFLLSLTTPSWRSSPWFLRVACSVFVWLELWYARSFATRSDASWAAFTASVLGMTNKDLANSAIANCSLDASDLVAKLRAYHNSSQTKTEHATLKNHAVLHIPA